jgi:hypothetical protein
MGKSAAGTQLTGHRSLKNEWEKVLSGLSLAVMEV